MGLPGDVGGAIPACCDLGYDPVPWSTARIGRPDLSFWASPQDGTAIGTTASRPFVGRWEISKEWI